LAIQKDYRENKVSNVKGIRSIILNRSIDYEVCRIFIAFGIAGKIFISKTDVRVEMDVQLALEQCIAFLQARAFLAHKYSLFLV
jgi:ABC-type glucose/galactose transport system permease subunit